MQEAASEEKEWLVLLCWRDCLEHLWRGIPPVPLYGFDVPDFDVDTDPPLLHDLECSRLFCGGVTLENEEEGLCAVQGGGY